MAKNRMHQAVGTFERTFAGRTLGFEVHESVLPARRAGRVSSDLRRYSPAIDEPGESDGGRADDGGREV